jgi:Ca2+-transporting ATPase
MLLTTVGASALTQLALVYVAPLQAVFQTEALGSHDMGLLLVLAACAFAMHEGRRRWERKREREEGWANVVEEMA